MLQLSCCVRHDLIIRFHEEIPSVNLNHESRTISIKFRVVLEDKSFSFEVK